MIAPYLSLSQPKQSRSAPDLAKAFNNSEYYSQQLSSDRALDAENGRNQAKPRTRRSNSTCATRPFFHPTPQRWSAVGTDAWLDKWWDANKGDFDSFHGFAATFASQYLDNPDWTCEENGMSNNCGFKPCDIVASDGVVEQPYYIIESISRLHSYFGGYRQALLTSATTASLALQDWSYTFYKDKDAYDMTFIKELINFLAVIISIASIAIAPELTAVTAVYLALGTSTATGGVLGSSLYSLHTPVDNTPIKAAALGRYLSDFFTNTTNSLVTSNNQLMAGEELPDGTDIRSFMKDGTLVDYPGVNQTEASTGLTDLLMASAVNQLWHEQKIFIMGGGPCDESGGIGHGPQEAKLCLDGKAWFAFYWRENLGQFNLGKARWGYVSAPPGFDHLGTGNMTGVTIDDVIRSSVLTHQSGIENYNSSTFFNQTMKALQSGQTETLTAGREGIFTLPVCNLSGILNKPDKEINKKSVILQPWGKNMVPQWCGPICSNSSGQADRETTLKFLDVAQMHGFQSFFSYCPRGNWIDERPPMPVAPVY
ncbi:MAG: hypothetical protein M1814_005258 [Vezdaea aestivalis]|nr:MAG: hypothetical protein M1814_005258 [Vezdaea aestivalis]